jgi:lysophospholipase L1-like esterase
LCASTPISNQQPRVDVNAYANNLKTIAGVARAHGIRLVLMTQQSTWNGSNTSNLKEWQSMLCRGEVRYREDLMDEALEAFNNQTRQAAQQYSVPLYDLASTMAKSREFFYDDVHFNNQGAHAAGLQLAALIQQLNLTSDRPTITGPVSTPDSTKKPN